MRRLMLIVCISMIFVSFVIGYVNAAVDPNTAFLVWTFDEGSGTTVADKSNQGNDGAITNAQWVAGKYGNGLSLDGATAYVKSATVKGVGKSAFSECLWVKFDNLDPENQFGYISCTDTANARFFYFSTWSSAGAPNDAIHCGTLDTGGNWGRGISTGRVFKTGQWYFVTGVIDTVNGFIRVYMDGAMVQEQAIDPGDTPGTPAEIWVGSSPEGYTWLAGTIDDAAFFNVALSESDINDIMKNGIASLFGTTAVSPSGKLPIEWARIKTQ